MDGIGGKIKNVVSRQVKSARVILYSAEEFSVTASKFVPSIAMLFQKEKDLFCEPDDATLQIHKFARSSTAEGGTIIDFYFVSNGKKPCHTQSYSERKCVHVEREYESSTLFGSLWSYCIKKKLRGKWGWRLVKMPSVSPVVSRKVLRTVVIMWFDGQ